MSKIKVLIADDSALMRRLLKEILDQDPGIEVVGAVGDAFKAREEIKRLDPDVLTLDVEMPRMDGISFLEKLMRLRPMPVVMISAWTEKGADITMKALMLGAIDFIHKPTVDVEANINQYADRIREKVRTAAAAKTGQRPDNQVLAARARSRKQGAAEGGHDVIAIGASTGGVEAIHKLLSRVHADLPPIVITQHIPPVFSTSFARRLNEQLPLTVCEAMDGQRLMPGHVYVAPGDRHLLLMKDKQHYVARTHAGQPVNRHMPSVDVLFGSVSETAGNRAIGVLLTGMGDDGARGLLAMRDSGAVTIAQDRHSSVVWGMPREAAEIGAASHVLPLDKIAGKIMSLCDRPGIKGEPGDSVRVDSRTAG